MYGRPEGWDFAIKLYVAALAELPLDVLDQAASAHLSTSKYFPKPSELLELTVVQMSSRRRRLENALEDQTWPKWLEEIYGPKPEGPARRAAAIRTVHDGLDRDKLAC